MNSKVSWPTIVEGDLKATFSKATTQGVEEGTTLLLGLFHRPLICTLMLSVKQGDIKYHFLSLV